MRVKVGRWFRFRWVQPIFNVLLAAGILYVGITGQERQTALSQVEVSTSVIQAFDQTQAQTNRQQGIIIDGALVKFFAMQAYLCQAAVAHNATLGGPPAPAGICDVTFPAPKAP